jgi:uncharacterized phage protein (TIGR02218 family)
MKATVAAAETLTRCMRIEPVSASPIYLTDYPRDLVIGGNAYLSISGYQFTGYSSTADFSPASIDLEGIADVAGISRAAIASGVFDGARCYVFATSWSSPIEDEEPITAGIFGKATLLDDRYQIGGVSLIDALNQAVGATYGAACPKTFCGQEYAGCMASLAANTVTGTLTHVTSTTTFRDSARAEAADTFGAGTIQFTSGANAGLKPLEIKAHAADGTITTFDGTYYLPVVGDSYSMVRGCRKRLIDCQNRVGGSNVVNFGGFLYIPAGSTYAHIGRSGAA